MNSTEAGGIGGCQCGRGYTVDYGVPYEIHKNLIKKIKIKNWAWWHEQYPTLRRQGQADP